MEPEVRYCTAKDGVRIAYCIEGEGPPLLVAPQSLESFALTQQFEGHELLISKVSAGRRLIRFDRRGCGLSQRDVSDLSLAAAVDDMRAVCLAANANPVSILSGGLGGVFSLAYAAAHPDGVRALVLIGGLVRLTDIVPAGMWQSFAQLATNDWTSVARVLAGITLHRAPELARRTAAVYEQTMNAETFVKMTEDMVDIDVTPQLERVDARTLVIHSKEDTAYPSASAQKISARVKDGRLVAMEGVMSLLSIQDEAESIAATINRFLDEKPETRALSRIDQPREMGLRTILFTDLVGHTEMMSRLGDEAGRAVLREHETITRKTHGGTEVKTMGDGFMASFASVTRAVECAIALQRAIEARNTSTDSVEAQHPGHEVAATSPDDLPSTGGSTRPSRAAPGEAGAAQPSLLAPNTSHLSVRVGLNAGEPIEEDGDLFGATVILASRIAAKAQGGEILVADTVRGLCSGKGFLFADRGEFVAKGFEDPVRVYEVSWRP
jgi:class 3 adenylate cyclase/pimeloyl-ACP methyl ester carboxylesterase